MELVLHRPVRQAQPRCDLPVGETSRREAGDLKLRGGEGSPSRNGGGEGRCSGTLAASGQHAGAWLRGAAVRSGARPRLHRRRPQQREALHHTRRRPRSSTQVPEHPPTRGQRRGRREPARVDLRRPRQAPVSEGRGSPTHCEPTAATACHGRPRPTPRRVAPQSSPGPQQAQPEPRNKEKRPCLHGAFLDRLVVFGSTECAGLGWAPNAEQRGAADHLVQIRSGRQRWSRELEMCGQTAFARVDRSAGLSGHRHRGTSGEAGRDQCST